MHMYNVHVYSFVRDSSKLLRGMLYIYIYIFINVGILRALAVSTLGRPAFGVPEHGWLY